MLGFTATRNAEKKGVDLNWVTSTELKQSLFEIERSFNGDNWLRIGKVKANEHPAIVFNYYVFDHNPGSGMNYYRIKQMNSDGSTQFSAIKFVNMIDQASTFTISPNPASNTCNIAYYSGVDDVYQIEISNSMGKICLTQSYPLKAGENHISLDLESLAPGMYFVKIYSDTYLIQQIKPLFKIK